MDIMETIREQVEGNPVVLYMKGTPQFPMCGFSAQTVQALKATNAEFVTINVLENPDIRQNLPRYADWPTFPQLYVAGELVGGCDIVMELYHSGELQQIIDAAAGKSE